MNPATAEPRDFARALVLRFNLSSTVDLYDLASKVGLRIKEVDARGFEGALVRVWNKPNGIVAVRRSIRERGRKRFTIAHEMGHYFLPGHGSAGRTCKSENIDSGSRAVPLQEAAANSFASELLLRTTEVEVVVRKRLASIETAKHLASIFDTSLTAALLKTVEVTNERCCVVMSKDGRIEWARPNDTFRHYVPRREKLDHETLANRLMTTHDQEARGLVPAAAWLNDERLKSGARIYEDSIRQTHYNSVLTILTINEPVSDHEQDDDDSLLEDLDPNEFTIGRTKWPG